MASAATAKEGVARTSQAKAATVPKKAVLSESAPYIPFAEPDGSINGRVIPSETRPVATWLTRRVARSLSGMTTAARISVDTAASAAFGGTRSPATVTSSAANRMPSIHFWHAMIG